jgi:hypothetical protein
MIEKARRRAGWDRNTGSRAVQWARARRKAAGLGRAAGLVLGMVLALSFLGASCGQGTLGILPGVVNDPKNLSLRKAILGYGTGRMCSEMMKRSIPLKLREEDPIIGRFYATSCSTQDLANNHVLIQFAGYGYAWTNLTKRMTFDAGGAVEYDQDFLMDGSTMYIYFRQQSTTAASFNVGVIELPATNVIGGLGGQSTQSFANTFGTQILKSEIARGFTVIRDDGGSVLFGLGVVEKGKRPKTPYPYKIQPSGNAILANERTEVHQEQRDFAGPFEVDADGKGLTLSVSVDGAPTIDVLVIPRATGQEWLHTYTHVIKTTPPPGPPMLDDTVSVIPQAVVEARGTGAPVWRRTLRVPQGEYYVVFDNTSTAGRSSPPNYAGDDRAALVSYAVEVGDPP